MAPRPQRSTSAAGGVRRQLDQLGHRPRKRLGQHFLSDTVTAEQIVALAGPPAGETIVEIGPGLGVLSELLAAGAGKLFLVELDRGLAEHLRQRYAAAANVEVVAADALRVDFNDLLRGRVPAVAVGNLPYNVATAILTHLLEQPHCFRRLVLMLQREVADRLIASPGTHAYGVLGILTQVHADVRIAFAVGPEAFVPPPQVESAVVVVDVLESPRVPPEHLERFRTIVRSMFRYRRKQLGNAARGIFADAHAVLRAADIDPRRRPETLSLAEIARLARESD